MSKINIRFNWVVEDDGQFCGRFVRRADAIAFARPGQVVRAETVTMAFGSLMVPRRNLAGVAASSPAECIGVW